MAWKAMALLGAYHGINPGMGWLFAVALGMQEGSARGVWRALPPIALGHTLAIGLTLAAAGVAQLLIPPATLKIVVAGCLGTLGLYRLWTHRHPRFGGMRVGFQDLTMWSFLMAWAHGAGFMVLPFVMALPAAMSAAGSEHAMHGAALGATAPLVSMMAACVHSAAYLAVTGLAAQVVYRKLGLSLLRIAWFNLDWLWACALLATGAIVLLR